MNTTTSHIDKAFELLDHWSPIHAEDRFCDSVIMRINGELESGAIRRKRISSLMKTGMLAFLILINVGTFGYLIASGSSSPETRREQLRDLAESYSIESTSESYIFISE